MHIYFSGIGGTGIGPLAIIAKQAGHTVSGSDKQDSSYISYLRSHGVESIHIGQSRESIATVHETSRVDWFVYSSALEKENPNHPELVYCRENNIRTSKRDELLNEMIHSSGQKLIAVAGTHGKTTTTAMLIWLLKSLDLPISYSVGAKTSFSDMGHFDVKAEYFVYECDEYDRNFLAFKPFYSIITGISWDHHDIFPTKQNYQEAFKQFFDQSQHTLLWTDDLESISEPISVYSALNKQDPGINTIHLLGAVNRYDAWQVAKCVASLTGVDLATLIEKMNQFPGVSRRFERIKDNLYTDYAHTSEKIKGALQVALESSKNVTVVYEGLHNRRQHFMLEQGQFDRLFDGAQKLYWVPSYLAREDPNQQLLTPIELINLTDLEKIAEPAELGTALEQKINKHIKNGDLVLCISAGGGGSLDEWIRTL